MANSIELITKHMKELDKVYKYGSRTAVLDIAPSMVREASDANAVKIAKMSLQGLGNYNRTTGYVQGDAALTWETHTFTQDRGRKFVIDAMDDQESANIAFGMLAGEFLRTQTIPELDAYRMAAYAANAGTKVEADLANPQDVLDAIDAASLVLDDNEVDEENRILFISHANYNLLKTIPDFQRRVGQGNDGTFDRDFIMLDSMPIVKMPASRFYTSIDQYDGTTAGQEAGGYAKASAGKDLNFQIVDRSAVVQMVKHNVSKIIEPSSNQSSDGWMYFFRAYHDAFILENRAKGIYSHYKTA